MAMHRFAAVVLALCVTGVLMTRVEAECCYSDCCYNDYFVGYDGLVYCNRGKCCAYDRPVEGTYCGVGRCNIFGCNCDGGCQQRSTSSNPLSATVKAFRALDTDRDCHISVNETIAYIVNHYHLNTTLLKAAIPADFVKDLFSALAGSRFVKAGKILPEHFDHGLAKWKCVPKKA